MSLDRMSETNHARAELYETMALLSDRLNFAKRFDEAAHEKKEQLVELKREKPVMFYIAVGAVSIAVGTAVWFASSKIAKKLRR